MAFEPDADLIALAESTLYIFSGNLLDGRVEGIPRDGRFLVMEVELIEPELYFYFGEGSGIKFVKSFLESAR